MAPVAQTAMSKTKRVVANNTEAKGRRVVSQQAMGIVTSVAASVLALYASLHTEEECSSAPVRLREWFQGLLVFQVCSVVFFFCTMYAVLSVMDSALARIKRTGGSASGAEQRSQDEGEVAASEDPVEPVGPANPDEAEEGYVVCCTTFMIFLFVFMAFLCFFLMVWSIVGLASVIDANSEQNHADCKIGRLYFWILAVLTCVNVGCFKGGVLGDLFRGAEWPALLPALKRRPAQGQVEVSI